MNAIFLYVKHFLVVALILLLIGFAILTSHNGSISLGVDEMAFKVGDEGPHIFLKDGQREALYIRGSEEQGFYTERFSSSTHEVVELPVYVHADGSEFTIEISNDISSPPVVYDDTQDIIAVSDLEGKYKAFRDFLIANKVIDESLNWIFGKGHLVLVGDMVDRGYSTTQLLWLVYKLEKDALEKGGRVHYIIGNHEIKNLQGNFMSAAPKYLPVSGILGVQQHELFGEDSLIGQWMQSKNSVELINGHLFMHGGLHPDIATTNLNLNEINHIIREQYRRFYFHDAEHTENVGLLTSSTTGLAWYRGYFKDELVQIQVDESLAAFDAKAVVVGHTVQSEVNHSYNRKVFAIDVKHPGDFGLNFPFKSSEGLLISKGKYYRLLDDGERVAI